MDHKARHLEREKLRLPSTVLDSVRVRNLDDIKLAINKLINNKSDNSSVSVSTFVNDGKGPVKVTAEVHGITPFKMIYDSLIAIKLKMEMSKNLKNGNLQISSSGFNKIDPLIKRYLGGYRIEHFVCWDIEGYRYIYDISVNRLTRSPTTSDIQKGN